MPTETQARTADSLLPVLRRLDALLERALEAAQVAYGVGAAADAFRGLHISREDAATVLARSPAASPLRGGQHVPTDNGRAREAEPAGHNGDDDTAGAVTEQLRRSLFGRWRRTGGANGDSTDGVSSGGSDTDHADGASARAAQRLDAGVPELAGDHPRLTALARAFSLSRFDCSLIVIALAPELDLRYERLYAYLQDDVTRRRPSVELALNLLAASAEEKWSYRARLDADAPLRRHGLVSLVADPTHHEPPLIGQYLKLDDRIVDHLLGTDHLDERLRSFTRWIDPADNPTPLGLDDETLAQLDQLLAWYGTAVAEGGSRGLVLQLHGPDGAGKRTVAKAVCAVLGAGMLALDTEALLRSEHQPQELVRLAVRETILMQTPLYVAGFDRLQADEDKPRRALAGLVDELDRLNGITVLASEKPWIPRRTLERSALISIEAPVPDFSTRQALWSSELDAGAAEVDIHALANQFRFGPSQIRDVIATAGNRARWRAPSDGRATMDDLLAACRAHSRHKLGDLAQRIQPLYTWDDIVLPDDQVAQLSEMSQTVRLRPTVYGEWGFEGKLARGKGANAIFAGPSGTGKTMAAEIMAGELGLDLYKIDLSAVVSKYIGETEKNLERIFRAAQSSNAILFFDEADALFGKRSEVKDAHDRYANIEIAYLLQRMEDYDGIVILATNLKSNLDDAFVRRMQFIVDFPFPEEAHRLAIWRKIWPAKTPRSDDLDLPFMARQFRISGGNIKNVALAAAFLAAADGGAVTMRHLVQATRREYQKMGRLCSEGEFGPYYDLVRS